MNPPNPSAHRQSMRFRNDRPASVRSGLRGLAHPLLVAVALLVVSRPGRGDDSIVLADGSRVSGSIVSLGPDAIELESRSGIQKVSIVEVRELLFDGEPDSLTSARTVLRRDPQGALAELAKIEAAEIQAADPRIREEYEFLKVAAAARAATKADGEAAAQALATFLTRNARSHHFFAGQEILGDLYARLGKFAQAAAAYGELDRGPPALRVRSATRKARLLLLQGKPGDALKEFELATTIPTEDRDASSATQKGEARLGIATCLARNGKAADGVKAAREAIRMADPRDRQLLAAAFATLGECQRAAGGKEEDAVISFLTVDLVYNTVPERHAEALFNLVELWEAKKQPERARDARKTLTTTYPDSPWTQKLEATAKPS
jgi:tetratricopeptide (TPR) repeat protein